VEEGRDARRKRMVEWEAQVGGGGWV
jgi:hypothetical protein